MKYELGTTTELPQIEERTPRIGTRLGGKSGAGGNGNNRRGGGGGGGGGDRRDNSNQMQEEQFIPSKYRLLMWFLLLVILMTFIGLIGAYVFISINKSAEWQPFENLPFAVYVSTILILASSVSYELARVAIDGENQSAFRRWLVVTAGLGAMFIASQMLSWVTLVGRGVYLASNPYAGFYYVLTAAHAFHLIGGIGALGYLILRAWRPTRDPERIFKRQTAASVIGLYWHSMDGLWIVLFVLLAFWK